METYDGPGTVEYHNGNKDKAEKVRKSILANRLKGVVEGYVGLSPHEPRATRDELQRLQQWATARLAWLNHFPEEPGLDASADGPCVVTFVRTAMGAEVTCAALRVPAGALAGLWLVAGDVAPKARTWEELMVWVAEGSAEDEPVRVRVVESWTRVW